MNKEPRYHILSSGVVDRWEGKIIDALEMIVGHDCTWSLPARFLSNNDRMSDERTKDIPEESSTGVLERS
jgi:hypothetical protein